MAGRDAWGCMLYGDKMGDVAVTRFRSGTATELCDEHGELAGAACAC